MSLTNETKEHHTRHDGPLSRRIYKQRKKKKKKFICQCKKRVNNGRLPVKAEAHQSWLPKIKKHTLQTVN